SRRSSSTSSAPSRPAWPDDRPRRRSLPSAIAGRGRRQGVCMPISAYVLIQTEVGKAAKVTEAVRRIAGVTAADDVTRPYDVIVRAESAPLDAWGPLVVSSTQAVDGTPRTSPSPVVTLYPLFSPVPPVPSGGRSGPTRARRAGRTRRDTARRRAPRAAGTS